MARKASNELLQKAKKSKSDEFYTQLCDIESELQHYHDCFRDKVVYCNCDDPLNSNFFKYFAENFQTLGLRRLIASCYGVDRGFFGVYNGGNDKFTTEDIEIHQLNGDGDFRSAECVQLLEEADVVVTNPPFSLFREFVTLLASRGKQFLIIGNVNAITYKEIFALIQQNEAWLGVNLGRGISGFIVPEHYDLYGTEAKINEFGQRIVATNSCLWLTNLEQPFRHDDIKLTKCYAGNEANYPTYDNCNGINVNKTQDIPCDYPGLMGVPITFLHKYNPEQFEIVRFRKGDDGKDLRINGENPYFRILIRNRRLGN